MKRYRLYIMACWLTAWAMTLVGCSTDALPEDTGGGKGGAVNAECYINLQIVGNSQAKTRATFSDQATAAENAVYDGILCVFEGATESTATLKTAVAIDQLINNPGSTANSQSLNITQRLADGTRNYSNNLYVLALLNTTSTGFSIGGTNKNELYFNGSSKTNNTISQIQALTINSVGSTDKHVGLFMSNAPQSGYIMPEVNTDLTTGYLFDTEAAAAKASNRRLTINVERAAARVKVTNAASNVTSFSLDGDNTRHATVHKMTWALHNYNTQCYAIRNGSTAADNWATSITGTGIPISFVNTGTDAFDLYQQHSYKDGDDVYVAENTTTTANDQTQVFVEVQLKDGSFLLGDCYRYNFGETTIFFTSAAKFIQYCKTEWTSTFARWNSEHLRSKSAEEIFKYPSLSINANGSVTVTLTNDSFNTDEKNALAGLSNTLSGTLRGYRDGKMYFHYKINHDATHGVGVVRNNAYNLTFTNVPGIGDPVPTPIINN